VKYADLREFIKKHKQKGKIKHTNEKK